jgi:methionyl-tRNA formyltransferase
MCGAQLIGVTAIRPDTGRDSGPIYASRAIRIAADASLQTVFELQARAMVEIATEILEKAARGTLCAQPQDDDAASYSLWRDEYDYFVDWRMGVAEIIRHVQATGFPYHGAKGVLDNEKVTILEVSPGPDIPFAWRDPGKLWQVEDRRALVVCGAFPAGP